MSNRSLNKKLIDSFVNYICLDDIVTIFDYDLLLKAYIASNTRKNPGIEMIDAMLAGNMKNEFSLVFPNTNLDHDFSNLEARVLGIISDDIVMRDEIQEHCIVPSKSMREKHAPKSRKRW